jgi:hypothetical protein
VKKIIGLSIVALAAWPLLAVAEHADISLRVSRLDPVTGETLDQGAASADQEPPAGGVKPRPLFKVKAKEPLQLEFFLTNTYPHGVTKNVTVRYFVVRVEGPRQKKVPNLDNAVLKGEFQMHFKPKCRVGARVAFSVPTPGTYLVRLDTLNTNSDHEHFSALDLQVE